MSARDRVRQREKEREKERERPVLSHVSSVITLLWYMVTICAPRVLTAVGFPPSYMLISTFPYALCAVAIPWSPDQDTPHTNDSFSVLKNYEYRFQVTLLCRFSAPLQSNGNQCTTKNPQHQTFSPNTQAKFCAGA